jgi:hypothetical protein
MMIGTTLVEADVKRPPMREGEVSERDPAAGFTRRRQRSFFGCRARLAVDRGADLIRRAILASAGTTRRETLAEAGLPRAQLGRTAIRS